MAVDTTAQVAMDVEFHWPPTGNPETYELVYDCLAVTRIRENTWVVNSEDFYGASFAVPCLSSLADLKRVRRKKAETLLEDVDMPVRWAIILQQ